MLYQSVLLIRQVSSNDDDDDDDDILVRGMFEHSQTQ